MPDLAVGQVWWHANMRTWAVVYKVDGAGAHVGRYNRSVGHGRAGIVWARSVWSGGPPRGWAWHKDLDR